MNQLKIADIMVVVGVLFLLVAHGITNFTFWYLTNSTETGATAKQYAQLYEANPLAVGLVQGLSGYALIISYIILPSLLFSTYYMMRKQFIKTNPTVILFIGTFTLSVGFLDAFNDISNLLGILLQHHLI